MFYEKLRNIYRSSDCADNFPSSLLDSLETYLSNQLEQNKRLISPYKFALINAIQVKEAITFFMYFSQTDGIFNIRFFFDCSRYSCQERVFLSHVDLNEPENYINCPECDKEYRIGNVIEFVKAYFEIKQEFSWQTPIGTKRSADDPNSTILALKGMPDHLKVPSPSSDIKTFHNRKDEGDSSVDIKTLAELNQQPNGRLIINDLSFLMDVTAYLRE